MGIIPALLADNIGSRKTMLFGGLLLTGAHLLGAMMFADSTEKTDNSVCMLFLMGIVGGQGASMIFLSAWAAMLKYHSILNTSLITAILFGYFLGSDTFHLSLKNGLYPDMNESTFLYLIAICGLFIYILAAFICGKAKAPDEDKLFAKGMILKKGITMYAAVQALYMAVCFLLLLSFNLGTQYGSIILLSVTALNLLIPILIVVSMTSGGSSNMPSMPGEQDALLKGKGKNVALTEAFSQPHFWFLMVSVAVSNGISRMMDENANLIALKNADYSLRSRRNFQTFEVVGAFLTGAILAGARATLSPYAFMVINGVLLVIS